jgi:hypothetical protein
VRGNTESDANTRTPLGEHIATHVSREAPTMACKAGMASAPQQPRLTALQSAAAPRDTRGSALANASARPREKGSAGLRAAAMLAGAAICAWGELEMRSGRGRAQQSLAVATTASGAAGAAMDEPFEPATRKPPSRPHRRRGTSRRCDNRSHVQRAYERKGLANRPSHAR